MEIKKCMFNVNGYACACMYGCLLGENATASDYEISARRYELQSLDLYQKLLRFMKNFFRPNKYPLNIPKTLLHSQSIIYVVFPPLYSIQTQMCRPKYLICFGDGPSNLRFCHFLQQIMVSKGKNDCD